MPGPTAEERRLAQLERRDPNPDESPVRVRVRLCSSDGFAFGRYLLTPEPDTIEPVNGIPVMAGLWEGEMFPSHVEALERLIAAEGPKPEEIRDGVRDLGLHVNEVAASNGATVRKDRSAAELLAALRPDKDGNRLEGKTSRTYRPSWPASFHAATGRDFFPVLSVELIDKPAEKPTNAKR